MIQDQRVIYSGSDISINVNDFRSSSALIPYEVGQYIYVGSILPFNNLWFDLLVKNTLPTTISVDIWWGNAWVPAVDILDESEGMTKNGRLNFNTNRLKGWDIEQTTDDVAGLEAFEIYWRYWVRLSWSADFNPLTSISYVGQRFSNDEVLYSFYPDLSQQDILLSFESGKTTWDEQHYMAAEHIVMDLKKRNIVRSKSQLMDWSIFQAAACHRIAEMVYMAFGSPYFDQMKEARKSYNEAMNIKFYQADLNASGSLDPAERTISTGYGRR